MDPILLTSDWLAPVLPQAEALVAALVSSVATLALILGFAPRRRAAAPVADTTACEFLLVGASLKALTEPARCALIQWVHQGAMR